MCIHTHTPRYGPYRLDCFGSCHRSPTSDAITESFPPTTTSFIKERFRIEILSRGILDDDDDDILLLCGLYYSKKPQKPQFDLKSRCK